MILTEAIKEELTEKLIGLIKSLSRKYLNKFHYSYLDLNDFIGVGYEALARCFNSCKEIKEEEFESYCKSAIYYGYQDVMIKIFAKKRALMKEFRKEDGSVEELYATEIPIDAKSSFIQFETDGGFADIEYTELIQDISMVFDNPIEKKIFLILADPPEKICQMAIFENHRKKRSLLSNGKKRHDVVRISPKIILKYLNDNGDFVSENTYYPHYKKVRSKVMRAMCR